MADVQYLGAGTRSSAVAAATNPGTPSGLVAGDVMWLVDEVAYDADTDTAPATFAGWTLIDSAIGVTRTDGNTSGRTRQAIYRRFWQSGDGAPTVPYSGGASGGHTSRIYAARNADATTPIVLGAAVVTALSTTAIGPITGVNAPAGSLLAVVASCSNNLGSAGNTNVINTLTGDGLTFTEREEFAHTAGADQSSIVQTAPVPTATTVTAKTFSGGTWGQLQAVARMIVVQSTPVDPNVPIWTGGLESGDVTTDFRDNNPGDHEDPNENTVDNTVSRLGSWSMRTTVNGTSAGNQQRAERETRLRDSAVFGDIGPGDDLWFALSTRLAPGFQTNPPGFQLLTQWKNNDTGSPPIALHIEGGRWELQGGFGYPGGARSMVTQDLGPADTAVWVDWLFHIVFEEGPDAGVIDVWRDGVQFVVGLVPPGGTLYPGDTSYHKVGLYRSTTNAVPVTAHLDEMAVGYTRESVELDAPPEKLVAVGRAIEANTAAAARPTKLILVGQTAETSTTRSAASTKARPAGRVTELTTATSVSRSKSRTVDQAAESVTTRPAASAKARLTSSVVEADAAQPIAPLPGTLIGLATGTDLTQPVRAGRTRRLGAAAEASTSTQAGRVKARLIGRPIAAELAQPIEATPGTQVGQGVETGLAQPVRAATSGRVGLAVDAVAAAQMVGAKARAVQVAIDTVIGQVVRAGRTVTVAQADEQGVARTASPTKIRTAGQAAAADSAETIIRAKVRRLSTADETATAQPARAGKVVPLGQAPAAEAAASVPAAKARPVAAATVSDSALTVSSTKAVPLSRAFEASGVRSTGRAKTGTANQAIEQNVARLVERAKVRSVRTASGAASAAPVGAAKASTLGRAVEEATSPSVGRVKDRRLVFAVETGAAAWTRPGRSSRIAHAVESGTAGTVARSKLRRVAIAVTREVVQGLAGATTRVLGPALENEAARVASAGRAQPVGRAHEIVTVQRIFPDDAIFPPGVIDVTASEARLVATHTTSILESSHA